MEEPSTGSVLRELSSDLKRKYALHAAAIERAWRSFDKGQRAKCLKAGAAEGVVLKHSLDTSLGNVYKFAPELNLRDITSEPEFLLQLLKRRATKSLLEQYYDGREDGTRGDASFIREMMHKRNLQHAEPFKNCYTMFIDENEYGKSYRIKSNHDEVMADFAPFMQRGAMVPQSTGELILMRQSCLLQSLNILIEDILEESETRDRRKRSKKSEKAVTQAISKLTFREAPAKLTFPDLVASAQDQNADLEDYIGLLSTEPVVLSHAVNSWFFSQPELIADEKGRSLPVHTDKYVSAAFFNAMHMAIKGAAIWNYLERLLELLQTQNLNRGLRAVVLQELSNTCATEYGRVQAVFKRYVQRGIGSKRFKRISNQTDPVGNPRVTMKGNPEPLLRDDPQLHYLLCLCLPTTNALRATDYMKKLNDLHRAHPLEREKMDDMEIDSLADLAVIVAFVQDLAQVVSMPSVSRTKGQTFVSRLQVLEAELNLLSKQIDMREFVIPIDNLLEPGRAEAALKALDQFIVEKAGTKMGLLYQDLVEDCFSEIQQQHEKVQAELKQDSKVATVSPSLQDDQQPEKRLELRKSKEKTRPAHSSIYEFTNREESSCCKQPTPSTETYQVNLATAEVFTTMFTKAVSRGAVNWTAFEAAMTDLGFSIIPKFGSVFTFFPPETWNVQRSFTVHRPHGPKIEGHVLLRFARRLRRVYGWSEQSFEAV
ncbi:ipa protein [Coniella lustricola]|uniref:Ipa protein n=1 Tax=Coniella lustricola TaxID=2025994 RepID=A0A2T3AC93_9PEZI|nr:ipa protein [Coniella lustricola]